VQLTIRPTMDVFNSGAGTLRIWVGETEDGIPVEVYIGAVIPKAKQAQFVSRAIKAGLLKSTFADGKIGTRKARTVRIEDDDGT
jgi:hypothetical protein